MATFKPATLGSISHATLCTDHLLSAFCEHLEYLVNCQTRTSDNAKELDKLRAIYADANEQCYDENGNFIDTDEGEELASEYVNEMLFDALNEFAPPYCYFGASVANVSDFGFWPCSEAIAELEAFSDTETALASSDTDLTEFKVVNDHGNVAIYRIVRTAELVIEFV